MSLFYKFDKIIPLSKARKLKLYLDLEWIFERLAHEQSFRVFGQTDHPARHRTADFLVKHLDPSHEVLDLGCNSGDLTFLVSQHVKAVTGIDYNSKQIEEAKIKYGGSNMTFVNDDAIAYMKNNNKRFDVLILSHILEHLDEPGLFLDACKSYCSHIYIEVPDVERTHLNIYREKVRSRLMYSDADHIWEFERQGLQKLILESGLVIRDMEFIWGVQKYWCAAK